jgi:hypothetical protein
MALFLGTKTFIPNITKIYFSYNHHFLVILPDNKTKQVQIQNTQMKQISLLALIIILITSCSEEDAKKEAHKRYEIESGMVKYNTNMMGIQSESVLYFKDYGRVECTDSKAKNMGQESHSRRFIKDGYAYTLDMNNKTGSKMKVEKLPDSVMNPEDIDFNNIPKAIKKRYNIQQKGEETVAGKTCKIYTMEMNSGKAKQIISVWKNIPLRIEFVDEGIQIITTAVEIKENPDLPNEIFSVPEDFSVSEYKSETPESESDNKQTS